MSVFCAISKIQRNISRKSPILTYPKYLTPPLGVTPLNFKNYKFIVLSYNVVCIVLRLAVLIQPQLVTDVRTDWRTDTGRNICHASRASRGKRWTAQEWTKLWGPAPSSPMGMTPQFPAYSSAVSVWHRWDVRKKQRRHAHGARGGRAPKNLIHSLIEYECRYLVITALLSSTKLLYAELG